VVALALLTVISAGGFFLLVRNLQGGCGVMSSMQGLPNDFSFITLGEAKKIFFAACLLTAGQAIFLLPMIRSGLASREKREGEIA
jgi:hypothetical protein